MSSTRSSVWSLSEASSLSSVFYESLSSQLQRTDLDADNDVDEERLNCFEFMSLMHLDEDPDLKLKIFDAVLGTETAEPEDPQKSLERVSKVLPRVLWFLAVFLKQRPRRVAKFVQHLKLDESLLSSYLQTFQFSEIYLDNVFESVETAEIPVELFRHCPGVRILSLKNNFLQNVPAEVGRLAHLEKLYLTNNRLENWSIPHTLTFCRKLKGVYLDHNLLDALPSVLLTVSTLKTVHRHGNHNYFKSTFMWYHTDVNGRILESAGRPLPPDANTGFEVDPGSSKAPARLQSLCAAKIISAKLNFFAAPNVILPDTVKHSLAEICEQVNLCGHCSAVRRADKAGYKVFTFKNPYLGNTCVPFLHWACSFDCAKKIDVPARVEQFLTAREQDRQYERYVRESVSWLGLKGHRDHQRPKHRRRAGGSSPRHAAASSNAACHII